MTTTQKIKTFLWFDNNAEEAVRLYTSLFKRSRIVEELRCGDSGPGPKGAIMTAEFELEGQRFVAMNGGPHFKFNEAISLIVDCADQAEIDRYWEALSAVPESEQCGWLKDKYGLSWQIVPENMGELMASPGAFERMMSMKKLDIEGLRGTGA